MNIEPEFAAIIFGIASAITWGTGDFSGGYASKSMPSQLVVLLSQIIGGLLLTAIAFSLAEPLPPTRDLLLGVLAGVCGMGGLLALYQGAAIGRMSVVAPLSAIFTALIPVMLAFIRAGLPNPSTLFGMLLALFAVGLISANSEATAVSRQEVFYGIISGFGFGLFFLFVDLSSNQSIYWPLVAGRVASVTLMVMLVTAKGLWQMPNRREWVLIFTAGVFDAVGNTFYALATRYGRLDIAAVLASLYPAATVTWARIILKERLVGLQWVGVGLAFIALIFIAL